MATLAIPSPPLSQARRPNTGLLSAEPNLSSKGERTESFSLGLEGSLNRLVARSDGTVTRTTVGPVPANADWHDPFCLAEIADSLWLHSVRSPDAPSGPRQIRVLDLFAGCGGLSLGVLEACRALNLGFTATGIDIDPDACALYRRNIPNSIALTGDLFALTRGRIDSKVTEFEKQILAAPSPDIMLAGPPCQGHSDLNNATRRRDPRNALYFRVARMAALARPAIILVENVTAVTHDRGGVVGRTRRALETLGYTVDEGIVDMSLLGVPQQRKRHLLLAILKSENTIEGERAVESRASSDTFKGILSRFAVPRRDLKWAIADLADEKSSFMDRAANPTRVTRERIDWLFEHAAYELPDRFRPPCHSHGKHSYRSVYGRLHFDRPAPTITGGFETMGRGRFVHPTRPRTLTAHEAARIQFFPDFFDWQIEGLSRSRLAEMIGNAVPPKLSYVVALDILR